jgi:hypothetical protein
MAIALVVAIFPCVLVAAEISSDKPAEALYLQLGQVGLDPARVYQVRGASLDRGAIQISLEDGTIAFTEDAMGRITGASFEGDGEILLTPPSEVERRSLSLFTGMAILEERFTSGYFRFNDDTFDELRPDLRATENKQEFIDRWGASAKNLAVVDAMRLLVTFSQFLPINGLAISEDPSKTRNDGDRFLHARLQGTKHGVFDVFFDSTAGEQIQAGQAKTVENGDTYYDLWTSFTTLQSNPSPANRGTAQPASDEKTAINRMSVLQYTISAAVTPPKQLHANTKMECEVGAGEVRMLTFELSRFLRIESVSLNGKPVEFIHNPALEGTQLARQGNDVVAVMLSEPKRAGEKFELEFEYGGEVLAEAGSGLLYVGARGTWYPNRGLEMANFDMEFTYPEGWTLVATGKPAQVSAGTAKIAGEQASRWISDRPIPLAGFNLGKYREATTRAGDVVVETYATVGVERSFPSVPIQVVTENPNETGSRPPEIVIPSRPSPAQTEVAVGESAARAIQYFAERFGPFPFSHLALTQMPGRDSQGWPGLIFLSSYVFLTEQQRQELHYEPYLILIQQQVPAHETAHQWWGDLITWTSYRDQWFSEGLANYCSLMMLEEKNPAGFHEVMEKYRRDLVEKNKEGITPMEAGPVTLGTRLWSSKFPGGYEAISYGRGTWLFHMLRTMLKDAQDKEDKKAKSGGSAEEPFMRALRRVREKYEGKSISTRELLDVFAEELPSSLRYEGKSSLDWFLEGWINGTSMPKLELRSVKLIPKGTGMSVSGTILQKEAPQDLVTSVPVYGVITGRQPVLLGRVFADGEESSFHLAAPAGVHKIELDPYETILTSVK